MLKDKKKQTRGDKNFSAQTGFYYSWDFPAYDEGFFATEFSITAEFRYYLSKKKPAPRGTYLPPNFRHQKLETDNEMVENYSKVQPPR